MPFTPEERTTEYAWRYRTGEIVDGDLLNYWGMPKDSEKWAAHYGADPIAREVVKDKNGEITHGPWRLHYWNGSSGWGYCGSHNMHIPVQSYLQQVQAGIGKQYMNDQTPQGREWLEMLARCLEYNRNLPDLERDW